MVMILLNSRLNLLRYFNNIKSTSSRLVLCKPSNIKPNQFSTSSSLLFGNRNRTSHQINDNFLKKAKIAAVFLTGGFTYLLYQAYKSTQETSDEISLDLNHIYESCAVMFLSNQKLIEALGLPIKITSSESDLVREIHLRRQGNDLYSFISYRLQGSQNSGTVYCKLRMFNDSHKYQAEEILLKLDKKFNNKREIIIKTKNTKKDDN